MPETQKEAQTRRIALLIETSTSFGRGLLQGIANYARSNSNWDLFFEPSGADESIHLLKRWDPHGMLVRVHDRNLADRILQAKIPTVDLGYVIPDLFPWSLSNHQEEVGQLAGEHLAGRGFQKFAFCGWGPRDPSAGVWESQRLASFEAAVGRPVDVYQWPAKAAEREWKREQSNLVDWLAGLPKPVGIFACNDMRASHVLGAARLAGIRVPEDLGLIGVDNDEVLCGVLSPTLSSVALNLEGMGRRGAELLDGLLDGQNFAGEVIRVSPLGVMARQSTDVVATEDQLVIRAVRIMRKRLGEGIDVAGVVAALPISRKALEVRFKKALNRTPLAELTRLRIDRARELLRYTNWPIKRIASECGFRYLENFHAAFRRVAGKTPGEYRKEVQ